MEESLNSRSEGTQRGKGGSLKKKGIRLLPQCPYLAADFRPRDIAAGGGGAPLMPAAERILFRHCRGGGGDATRSDDAAGGAGGRVVSSLRVYYTSSNVVYPVLLTDPLSGSSLRVYNITHQT